MRCFYILLVYILLLLFFVGAVVFSYGLDKDSHTSFYGYSYRHVDMPVNVPKQQVKSD